MAHSSTGTSIILPSSGTAAVPAATPAANASRTRLFHSTSSGVGVKAALTGAAQLGCGQITPFMPEFLAFVASACTSGAAAARGCTESGHAIPTGLTPAAVASNARRPRA